MQVPPSATCLKERAQHLFGIRYCCVSKAGVCVSAKLVKHPLEGGVDSAGLDEPKFPISRDASTDLTPLRLLL
jgi:hypothetical protein